MGKVSREKIPDYQIYDSARVKVKQMGNITEITHISHHNEVCPIRNIDADTYEVRRTGEIREKKHWENRSQGQASLLRTFDNLRAVINTNCTQIHKCRWVTLTYRQNNGDPMTDSKQLYFDVKHFIQRLYRYCEKMNYGRPEYINVCEPQSTGAWHCHVILIFPVRAPFIACSNATYKMLHIERKKNEKTLEEIWGHGFVSIRSFRTEFGGDVDNVGAYVTAYLADLPLDEALRCSNLNLSDYIVKESRCYDDKTQQYVDKRILKGARLHFYPPKFNLYRTSRGIKQPIEYDTNYLTAKKQVSGQTLTYSADYLIKTGATDGAFHFVSSTRHYNAKKLSNQAVFGGDLIDMDTGVILESNYSVDLTPIPHREEKLRKEKGERQL